MFKEIFLIILCSCLSFFCFSQKTVEEWVHKGIDLHEQGQYDKAIATYKKALKIDKKSSLAFYEMSFAYMQKGDYKNAIKYSKKVLKNNKNYLLESYLINGSALDLMGKPDKGLDVLNRASKIYPTSHLIFFNLGIIYTKTAKHKQAKQALTKALEEKPNHANSHLALAQSQLLSENMPYAALSYIYFLLLEPDSKRSSMAYRYLSTIMDSPKYKIEKAGKGQPLFKDLEILFKSIREIEEETAKKSDIYSNFYIPFYNTVLSNEATETLEYYIGQHQGVMNTTWLNQNQGKVNELLELLSKNQ